jgi:hypothetical protein
MKGTWTIWHDNCDFSNRKNKKFLKQIKGFWSGVGGAVVKIRKEGLNSAINPFEASSIKGKVTVIVNSSTTGIRSVS